MGCAMAIENIYDNLQIDEIKSIQKRVEDNAKTIESIVNAIIQPYCKDLDAYVLFIKDCLKDGNKPPSNDELEDYCMNLSTFIYFAGGMCEQLGIKDDISKAIWKEMYHTKRQDSSGTVADKDSLAELSSQQEQLTNICYSRAYKTLKSKIDNAQELLSSCKKVLSHRMQEMELTKLSRNIT